MLEELCAEIVKWQAENDLIIVLMDANEHVGNNYMTECFETLDLKEALLDKHREINGTQPTYQRGSDPIDGICIAANITVQAAGYLPFGEGPSDHRGIWVKVKEDSVFGYSMEKLTPPLARRLTLEDPRVVKRWIGIYKELLLTNKLPQRAFNLQTEIQKKNWN